MRHNNGFNQLSSLFRLASVAAILAGSAHAAQFQFGALIQAGTSGTGDWEVAVGNSTASLVDTESLATHWANGVDRLVQLEYLKTTNTVNLRVYNGNTTAGAFTQASFQPAGGTLVAANAIWTLPANAFFVTAQSGPVIGTSMSVSNLALSGVSGAINVIQPIQQTTLVASRGFLGGTSTVSQSQAISFQADPSGNWRLQATVQINGLQPFLGLGAQGAELTWGVSASAVDAVPEPSTFGLMGFGGAVMIGIARRRNSKGPRSA